MFNELAFISHLLEKKLITSAQSDSIRSYLKKHTFKYEPITKEDKKVIVRKAVTEYFQVSWVDICGRSRIRNIVNARQVYMYFLIKYLGVTLHETGREVGNRDHTTAIHSHTTIQNYMDTHEEEIINSVGYVREQLTKEETVSRPTMNAIIGSQKAINQKIS